MSETPSNFDADNAPEVAAPPQPPTPPTPPATPAPPAVPVAQTPAPVVQTPAPAPAQQPAAQAPVLSPAPAQPVAAQTPQAMDSAAYSAPVSQTVTGAVPGSYGTQGMSYTGFPEQSTPAFQIPSPAKSFFSRLFDMSFSTYTASFLVKITYILSLVVIWGFWLYSLIRGTILFSDLDSLINESSKYFGGASSSSAISYFFAVFIGGGLLCFVSTLWIRLTLEFFVASANKAEDARRLRELKEEEKAENQ